MKKEPTNIESILNEADSGDFRATSASMNLHARMVTVYYDDRTVTAASITAGAGDSAYFGAGSADSVNDRNGDSKRLILELSAVRAVIDALKEREMHILERMDSMRNWDAVSQGDLSGSLREYLLSIVNEDQSAGSMDGCECEDCLAEDGIPNWKRDASINYEDSGCGSGGECDCGNNDDTGDTKES